MFALAALIASPLACVRDNPAFNANEDFAEESAISLLYVVRRYAGKLLYELEFHAGAWMDATGVPAEAPRFLDVIPIRFGMSAGDHYHVPLLVSPFGYSTYRGS